MNTYEAALREIAKTVDMSKADQYPNSIAAICKNALAVPAPPSAQEVNPVELLEYVGSRGFEYCEDGGWSNYSRGTSAWQSSDLVKEYKEFEAKVDAFIQSKTDNRGK